MKRVVPTLAAGLALVALPVFAQDSGPAVQQGAEVVGEELIPERGDVAARDLPIAQAWRPGDPVKDIPRRRYLRPGGFEPEAPVPGDPLLELQAFRSGGDGERRSAARSRRPGLHRRQPAGHRRRRRPAPGTCSRSTAAGARWSASTTRSPAPSSPALRDGRAGSGRQLCLRTRRSDRPLRPRPPTAGCSRSSPRAATTSASTSRRARPDGHLLPLHRRPRRDFPDYPKYGVWPDAYYVTTNESSAGDLRARPREHAGRRLGGDRAALHRRRPLRLRLPGADAGRPRRRRRSAARRPGHRDAPPRHRGARPARPARTTGSSSGSSTST